MTTSALKLKNSEKVFAAYEPYFKNGISLLQQAKKGLKPKAVFEFIGLSGLSTQVVEIALNKNMKTFQNYRDKNTLLDAPTSEKLLKLFALYRKGTEVFGSVQAFTEWLSKPAFGIGNTVPQSIIDTNTGIDLIKEELVRIAYGDVA